MITVTLLGSGSRGNALLVDGSNGTLLIDAGFGVRTLAKRFEAAQRRPEDVGALLLTHEHVDHACGAAAASDRWSWTVHASAPTHAALAVQASGAPTDVAVFGESGVMSLCGFTVAHTPLPHDASDCRAFVLTDEASGARAGIVLDSGHVPDGLSEFLERLDLLVVESNHDEAMLANGPYPAALKARIGGGRGHLSNASAAQLAAACAHSGLQAIVLAHLSETNNTPALAIEATTAALKKAGWKRDRIYTGLQRTPLAAVRIDAVERAPDRKQSRTPKRTAEPVLEQVPEPAQLSLFF